MVSADVIIIGGGAAGFFAAVNTAQQNRGYTVLLLEKSSKFLSKVRVSGGGRCNVTHACFDNEVLVKNYPRGEKELRNVFSRFTTSDTIQWFESRGIKLKTEADGRMFPESNRSETIIDCLMQEALSSGVQLKLQSDVQHISKQEDGSFLLKTSNNDLFQCKKLIIATGGHAKEQAYEWIRQLGHTIVKPVPSLFTFNIPDDPITQLMGVSVPHVRVKIKAFKMELEGPLLITHWGFSGPVVLKSSAIAARNLHELNYNFLVSISWLPKHTEEKIRIEFANQRDEHGAKTLLAHFPFELPKRLCEHFISTCNIDKQTRWADLSKKNISDLIHCLINNEYTVKGKTTFKEEFVTCGGVKLKEINFATMESKLVPHLYFAGEVLDIDGVTGGFNFQNAWSSGWIAAKGVSQQTQ
jgi:predicted Rossmann fold flavoprotein